MKNRNSLLSLAKEILTIDIITLATKKLALEYIIRNIEYREEVLAEFDEQIWMVTIEKVTVMPENKLAFQFKGGKEIKN